jgi:hypothetical protein
VGLAPRVEVVVKHDAIRNLREAKPDVLHGQIGAGLPTLGDSCHGVGFEHVCSSWVRGQPFTDGVVEEAYVNVSFVLFLWKSLCLPSRRISSVSNLSKRTRLRGYRLEESPMETAKS